MAETCIVCLGDLRTTLGEEPPPEPASAAPPVALDASNGSIAKRHTRNKTKSIETDEDTIAHLLPCGHDLHNFCLTPWVERANSCPICRATFNMVELRDSINGPVKDSYAVQDKVQQADIDPRMVVDDQLFPIDSWQPCIICQSAHEGDGFMYCHQCDSSIHVVCAGYDDIPDRWNCERCLESNETGPARGRSGRRARGSRRRRDEADPDAMWARVWQEVSDSLDLDLDFPFDDETIDERTEDQRREFALWQQRFEVASQQGATNRLRDIASSRLYVTRPAPESQEVLRAWNAFDKARESQDAPATVRRRKRRATASPAPSSLEAEQNEQPPQKRPRLRRPHVVNDHQAVQPTAPTAVHTQDRPTFLSSLLREVESKPISASSPGASDIQNGQISPRDSSPDGSSSGSATPRALSVTPPPQRPSSPPLSSTIIPLSSPISATFSPFSPTNISSHLSRRQTLRHRGRQRSGSAYESDDESPRERASSSSPSRGLSYSAKNEIQRMVKLALGSRYRDKEITKDQYTDINKGVSRKLYDLVSDVSALADQTEREKWQGVADDEVKKAIAALPAASFSDE